MHTSSILHLSMSSYYYKIKKRNKELFGYGVFASGHVKHHKKHHKSHMAKSATPAPKSTKAPEKK